MTQKQRIENLEQQIKNLNYLVACLQWQVNYKGTTSQPNFPSQQEWGANIPVTYQQNATIS